ncbi:hypothetical protein FNV43_RR06329 [Rhamnella rubrinervis]|uniref:Germin-like protein n=1 Tax=Rhamnella rubrinervis TaxID=2594499 RepID=A0A8K0HDL7_9ROSA|nr:hypothetical protein FNV43_RR06329 [Rhamnella rubrinervis]
MASPVLIVFGLLALSFSVALASDHSPLQDFCVSDSKTEVLVNGVACKDPKLVQADDFFFDGLRVAGNTSNAVGSKVTPAAVLQIPGLNTLGISVARVDYAPWGINPPIIIPKGDAFVFPVGLVHYQRNLGSTNAIAFAALSSQNPGVATIANAVFGSTPDIASDVLVKAFQLDGNVVKYMQSKF